jgi:hypothetical protein
MRHLRPLTLDSNVFVSKIKSADELEEKIRKGIIKEHSTWEDLIVLENLEERAEKNL